MIEWFFMVMIATGAGNPVVTTHGPFPSREVCAAELDKEKLARRTAQFSECWSKPR